MDIIKVGTINKLIISLNNPEIYDKLISIGTYYYIIIFVQ